MNLTDLAAWWGAAAGTGVLLWDIFKWQRSGPRLKVTAQPNMQYFEHGQEPTEKKHIFVTVSNIGDRETTITNLGGVYYPSWNHWIRNKPESQFVVPLPAFGPRIPHVLEPGRIWQGAMDQTDEAERYLKKGRLYVLVYASHANKPNKARIRTRK